MEETRQPCIPESLVRFEPPLYSGEGSKNIASKVKEQKVGKGKSAVQIEDILNSVLPPRAWQEDSGEWVQYTSPTPSNRLDVIQLQEDMDAKLIERQARDAGICPVREDIYAQCCDELIRQVTINCPERGLLTLRVRDEIRMTIDAYKTLYESSVTFGVRKQLQAEEGKDELEERLETLRQEKKQLENKVLALTNKVEVIEKRGTERRTLLEAKRKQEIDFLKHQGQHLDSFLKSAGGGK